MPGAKDVGSVRGRVGVRTRMEGSRENEILHTDTVVKMKDGWMDRKWERKRDEGEE